MSADKLYLVWQNTPSTTTTATPTTKTASTPSATEVSPVGGGSTALALQNYPASSTLTTQSSTLSMSPMVVTGSNPIQNPPKANFASVQGNGGQLSYSYSLMTAPGPQGTEPDLKAVYSSEATNERHAPTTPASNVGDGWDITLGAVSAEKYPDGTIWYSISGADNVNDRLIPDTSGTNFATQHISYLKVTKVTSGATGQPCFNVWGTEGNYYDYNGGQTNTYDDSSHPHQLKGLYPTGTSCTNPTGATYGSQYDAWGNVTSRTYKGATATLSYDMLDHLTQWNAGSNSQEWYAYDASGNRVIRRSTTGSGTSITTYAFGLEEHSYDASGNTVSSTYYYTLGGMLIGELTGTGTPVTQFFLTDTLGSILATFNATAGTATLQGNQIYGPYGNPLYKQGSLGTSKGFTGQYNDITGLDYYNARYYDPVIGSFLSADTVEDNAHAMNPYAYVAGNPETNNDPTGHGPWDWIPQFIQSIPTIITGVVTAIGIAVSSPAWIPIVIASALAAAVIALSVALISAPPVHHASSTPKGPRPQPAPTPNPSHNRPAQPPPSPTPSTNAGGVGSRCYNSPRCRDLEQSERGGGHTLRQHVNITPQAARQRAIDSKWYSSMFTDLATAQWAVDQALQSGAKAETNKEGYLQLTNVNVHKSIGVIWRPNGTAFGNTSYVTILISPLTWTILTAYPSHPSIPIK